MAAERSNVSQQLAYQFRDIMVASQGDERKSPRGLLELW